MCYLTEHICGSGFKLGMAGSKQHYLPASFIARFAIGTSNTSGTATTSNTATNSSNASPTTPRRKSCVFACLSSGKSICKVSAESLGFKNNLYNLGNLRQFSGADGQASTDAFLSQLNSVDSWAYEPELTRVLDVLSAGKQLSLSDWLHVAVPFVAGLFARGHDFSSRYEAAITSLLPKTDSSWNKSNTNMARQMRLQRLLAPVMAAQWVIYHASANTHIISSNLGLTPMRDPRLKMSGWAIPLSPRCALAIFPQSTRCVSNYDGIQWNAVIQHAGHGPEFFAGLNKAIASADSQCIFGDSEFELDCARSFLCEKTTGDLQNIMESGWQQLPAGAQVVNRFDWQLLAALADGNVSPGGAELSSKLEDVDYRRWTPFFFELPSTEELQHNGVAFRNSSLFITLHN